MCDELLKDPTQEPFHERHFAQKGKCSNKSTTMSNTDGKKHEQEMANSRLYCAQVNAS